MVSDKLAISEMQLILDSQLLGGTMESTWQELHTNKFDQAITFYRQAFNCDIREVSSRFNSRYALVISKDEQKPIAGIIESHLSCGWNSYIAVNNLIDTLTLAMSLGATNIQPFEIPKIGSAVVLHDANGQELSLIEFENNNLLKKIVA